MIYEYLHNNTSYPAGYHRNRLKALQKSLEEQEQRLDSMRYAIDNHFNEFSKEIIAALLKEYVIENDLGTARK